MSSHKGTHARVHEPVHTSDTHEEAVYFTSPSVDIVRRGQNIHKHTPLLLRPVLRKCIREECVCVCSTAVLATLRTNPFHEPCHALSLPVAHPTFSPSQILPTALCAALSATPFVGIHVRGHSRSWVFTFVGIHVRGHSYPPPRSHPQ